MIFISAVHNYAQPKIYLVRHSEKIEDWQKDLTDFQPLNKKGIETSQRLAKYFYKINLSAIYSSPVTRTLQTVYNVSKDKKLKIEIAEACNDTSLLDSFINSLNKKFKKNESVLIVSHSNIIPYFLIKLGLKKEKFDEMKFTKSNNWLVTDYYGEIFIIEQNKNPQKIYKEKF
ncbi:MAG: hypothetical protein A2068_11700 [Ignavibacteria bacterium GWB2_35_6b]|nr:MAG: hypothetical protein A2068_11700 [Ignavibacteria bacterium GWB2_35_6b]